MNAQKLITRDTNYKFVYRKHENQIYKRFTIENFKFNEEKKKPIRVTVIKYNMCTKCNDEE